MLLLDIVKFIWFSLIMEVLVEIEFIICVLKLCIKCLFLYWVDMFWLCWMWLVIFKICVLKIGVSYVLGWILEVYLWYFVCIFVVMVLFLICCFLMFWNLVDILFVIL